MTQLGDAAIAPLLERETELALIEQTIGDAVGGAGSALIVRGPAGIGKTRLLEVARSVGDDRGLRVLSARPGPLEGALPWGVARSLLADSIGDVSGGSSVTLAREVLTAGGAGLHAQDAPTTGIYAIQELTEAPAHPFTSPATMFPKFKAERLHRSHSKRYSTEPRTTCNLKR